MRPLFVIELLRIPDALIDLHGPVDVTLVEKERKINLRLQITCHVSKDDRNLISLRQARDHFR